MPASRPLLLIALLLTLLGGLPSRGVFAADAETITAAQPTSRTARQVSGWTVRVDDRLLPGKPDGAVGAAALRYLQAKLEDIVVVIPPERLPELRSVTIVLDLSCGDLGSMQYHPSAEWLVANGYTADLEKCVHLPRAAEVATPRNVREQPWCILHELAHAWHDQVLGFDEPRVLAAFDRFRELGYGEGTLLFNGERVRHYALTNEKEFFAEMTEAYFGANDFYPFNRAELKEVDPALHDLLAQLWQNPRETAPAETATELSR